MQLAEEKGCWLKDLDNIPSEELSLWVAYYQIKQKREEQAKREADSRNRAKSALHH